MSGFRRLLLPGILHGEVFNWLRAANRVLRNADLFRDNGAWRRGVLDLYRQRLGAAADGLSHEDLAPWVDHGYLATSSGLIVIGHEGRSRAESLPVQR